MIWPMAKSQMLISKKPSREASSLIPRETKMIRTVESVTTQISARKTSKGRSGETAAVESAKRIKGLLPQNSITRPRGTAARGQGQVREGENLYGKLGRRARASSLPA